MSATYKYKHKDVSGKILYVGITNDLAHRMSEHKRYSRWFDAIDSVEYEEFDDRAEAEAAEKEEIKRLMPPMNVVHMPISPKVKITIMMPTEIANELKAAWLEVPNSEFESITSLLTDAARDAIQRFRDRYNNGKPFESKIEPRMPRGRRPRV